MENHLRSKINQAIRSAFAGVSADLSLDDQGMVAIAFAKDVVVTIEVPRTGDHAYAHSPLLRLASANASSDMETALGLNFFQMALPNVWIALEREARTLTLCASLHADHCGPDELTDFLETFVAAVSATRDRLQQGDQPISAPAIVPFDPDPSDVMFIRS